MADQTVRARLRQVRERAGVPASELSEMSGLSHGVVSMIETEEPYGIKRPSYEVLRRLCKSLGASVEWLAHGDGSGPSDKQLAAAIERTRANPQPKLSEERVA